MHLSRRSVLAGAVGLSACLALPAAAATPDRAAWLAHVRARLLGFDVADVATRLFEVLRLPDRHLRAFLEVVGDRDLTQGFRSVRRLGDDPALRARLDEVVTRFTADPRVQLRMLRWLRRAPQTPAEREAVRRYLFVDLLGLDLDALRDAVAALPDGLAIVYGPVTSFPELAGLFLREPYALYLQLVHGRRAREIPSAGYPRSLRALLEALLDPTVRAVAFCGHGTWDTFALSGYWVDPEPALERLCRRAAKEPREVVRALARNSLFVLFGSGAYKRADPLSEEDLALLVSQAHPAGFTAKDVVVRYTCGTERYALPGRLLPLLVPPALDERLHRGDGTFSGRRPEETGWQAELATWLSDKDAPVTARAGLGRCLVAADGDTLGYEGLAWLDHFLADPLPAPLPPWPFPGVSGSTPPRPPG